MTVDPRTALERLITALERHFESAHQSRDPDHPMAIAAAQDLAEAFDDYDEALFEATGVATPLAIYGDDFDGHENEEGSPGVYAGLDSDEYDDDEDEDEDDEEYDEDDDDLEDDDEEDDEDDEDDDDLDDDELEGLDGLSGRDDEDDRQSDGTAGARA